MAMNTKRVTTILLSENFLPDNLKPVFSVKRDSPIHSKNKDIATPPKIRMSHPIMSMGQ
jgi:hypothetical protein